MPCQIKIMNCEVFEPYDLYLSNLKCCMKTLCMTTESLSLYSLMTCWAIVEYSSINSLIFYPLIRLVFGHWSEDCNDEQVSI